MEFTLRQANMSRRPFELGIPYTSKPLTLEDDGLHDSHSSAVRALLICLPNMAGSFPPVTLDSIYLGKRNRSLDYREKFSTQ